MDAAKVPANSRMSDTSFQIAKSALQYPQKFDATLNSIFFIPLTQEGYRKASFLDDRVLATGMDSRWVPYADVETTMSEVSNTHPLHFIFHTGHVGSTLLSRLVEETNGVLGLREPLPLRTLAELQDQNWPQLDTRLQTFLKLWRRGFADTTHVVVKATSSSGRLATRLLGASPTSQAVYLNLRAEPYLATLLAGANAMVDLNGFGAERASRSEKPLWPFVAAMDNIFNRRIGSHELGGREPHARGNQGVVSRSRNAPRFRLAAGQLGGWTWRRAGQVCDPRGRRISHYGRKERRADALFQGARAVCLFASAALAIAEPGAA